jgi:hypothetical protein
MYCASKDNYKLDDYWTIDGTDALIKKLEKCNCWCNPPFNSTTRQMC